jgi:shikimate kinase
MRGTDRNNVVLVGMPAAGKSTVGVLVAKRASLAFVDTDLLIQSAAGRSLERVIEEDGREAFGRLEEAQVLALDVRDTLVSTGGSVVYRQAAVDHLRALGFVVFLDAPLSEVRARIGDPAARGLVRRPGQTLDGLYAERRPLYVSACDAIVDCAGRGHAEVAHAVLLAISARG